MRSGTNLKTPIFAISKQWLFVEEFEEFRLSLRQNPFVSSSNNRFNRNKQDFCLRNRFASIISIRTMEICICASCLTGDIVFAFTNSSLNLIVHSCKLIKKISIYITTETTHESFRSFFNCDVSSLNVTLMEKKKEVAGSSCNFCRITRANDAANNSRVLSALINYDHASLICPSLVEISSFSGMMCACLTHVYRAFTFAITC